MQDKQWITHIRPFLTFLVQHKQRKASDNTFSPTPDYFNTRYAADSIQPPTADYNIL